MSVSKTQRIISVLWPSFLTAGLATALFFTAFDPQELLSQTRYAEASRLGGIPVFAMLGGVGWRRANDALGPVVRDTDGRVFTLATLPEMLTVEPMPGLCGRLAPA